MVSCCEIGCSLHPRHQLFQISHFISLKSMLAENNKIHTSKLKNLNFSGHPKESNVLTWLQQVCFLYMYLCLFDDILTTVLRMLPLKSKVNGVFNPINLHKCVINSCNVIRTYYSALHKDGKLNVKIQRPLGRFCR